MPNRIIRESICCSPSLDCICAQAETLFFRLLTAADDFGRFDSRPQVVLGRCFPLKLNNPTDYAPFKIEEWLQEILKAEMIELYEVRGVRYGQFLSWELHNSIRTKRSKYPCRCGHLQTSDCTCKQMIPSRARAESNPNPIQSNPNPSGPVDKSKESGSASLRAAPSKKSFQERKEELLAQAKLIGGAQ